MIGLGFQDQKKQARATYFFEVYSKPNTLLKKKKWKPAGVRLSLSLFIQIDLTQTPRPECQGQNVL